MAKFKLGDKVRIMNIDGWSKSSHFKKAVGKVGRITNIDDEVYFIDGNKYGINFKDPMLVKVKEEKFKVGDRVRSRQPDQKYTGVITEIDGTIATVERNDKIGAGWSCLIKGNKIATASGCWDDKHYLEKIGKPPKPSRTISQSSLRLYG